MNGPEFKLSVARVKERLLKIVEHRMEHLSLIEKKDRRQTLVLNEALLEDWN